MLDKKIPDIAGTLEANEFKHRQSTGTDWQSGVEDAVDSDHGV